MSERRAIYYVSEARKFTEAASTEFKRWRVERSDVLIRDAAEKAWNGVVQATNALLVHRGFSEDELKTHKDRRLALNRLGLKDPEIRDKGFRDRFGAREYYLHERCFYEGEYIPEVIEEELQKVEKYVEEVKESIKAS